MPRHERYFINLAARILKVEADDIKTIERKARYDGLLHGEDDPALDGHLAKYFMGEVSPMEKQRESKPFRRVDIQGEHLSSPQPHIQFRFRVSGRRLTIQHLCMMEKRCVRMQNKNRNTCGFDITDVEICHDPSETYYTKERRFTEVIKNEGCAHDPSDLVLIIEMDDARNCCCGTVQIMQCEEGVEVIMEHYRLGMFCESEDEC